MGWTARCSGGRTPPFPAAHPGWCPRRGVLRRRCTQPVARQHALPSAPRSAPPHCIPAKTRPAPGSPSHTPAVYLTKKPPYFTVFCFLFWCCAGVGPSLCSIAERQLWPSTPLLRPATCLHRSSGRRREYSMCPESRPKSNTAEEDPRNY